MNMRTHLEAPHMSFISHHGTYLNLFFYLSNSHRRIFAIPVRACTIESYHAQVEMDRLRISPLLDIDICDNTP
jgi:hypothetical protein